MGNVHEGQLDAKGKKFALVVSRFNEFITGKLLGGAIDCITRHGGSQDDIDVYYVPGALEIGLVASRVASAGKHDAVVCIGCVIRGATPHFDYVAGQAARAIAQVGLATGVPTIFGVLTADTIEQAVERAGTKAGNRGFDAAAAAIEMASLLDQL
jgi:6,7-dimethyl-8-ribityllumazine synthase